MPQHDDFNDLVFKLGDVAFERLLNKPTAPRAMDRAIKAADALAAKEDELAQLNTAMDEEETAFTEFLPQDGAHAGWIVRGDTR